MALSGGGGAGALFLGFIGFVVIVISIIFLSQKPSTSPAPAPVVGQEPGAPEPAPAQAPAPAPEPAPEPGPAPAPSPAPLVFGSITPRGPAPAPAPVIQQVFTTPPPPYHTPLDKLLNFLEGIPDMLLNRQNLVLAIADLIINRQKSMVYELVKGMFQKIARVPALSMKIKASIERRVAARTATGAIKGKFKFMSLFERARLGLSWGKTTTKLGENTGAKLAQEAGTRINVAEALGKAAAQSARATVSAGKFAGSLARGLVTDPLMVVAVTGMALDMTDPLRFAQITQTSDMLVERNDQLKTTAEATVDCSANPLGPKCPPSPGAAPAPGPAPPPKAGRFPRFLGPHDLMPVEAMFADLETNIYSLVGDPSDPKGGLKTTIDMIPSSTYLDVKNSLTALYNSIDITNPAVDGVLSPFIYTSPASQTIVQNAINTLKSKPKTTLLDVLINRLEIIFLMQGIVSNYIAQIRGNNYGDITLADFQQLVMTPLSDTVLDGLVDAMLDFNCVQNGGLVFNPGNGYDARTCTWATKEDCHGAFPWALTDGTVINDATQRTKDMMCTTTCPAPCPAGSPSPCPPPVSCPAPSPCAALSDPSKSDLTYTEWRSKDWFSKANWISSNPAWNAALDQNAIPSGGACIAADPGMHSFCDEPITTGSNTLNVGGTANNVYIRETGTCVNSEKMCAIKGVSYDWNMSASKLGGGNVEGSNYPSCYRSTSQQIAADIFGNTLTSLAVQGGIQPAVINSGNSVVDAVVSAAVNASFVMPIIAIIEAPQTAQALDAALTGGQYCPGGPGGACSGDALCTASTTYRNAGRTKYFDAGSGRFNCCKPTQTVDSQGNCIDPCRADQVRGIDGRTCVCGGSKPISFGDHCGTTAECPACTGGKIQTGTMSCVCTCPAGYYDDNGTCRMQGTCPPGKMYTSTGRPMSTSDCVTACSGATPVWNPDTQTCVAAASCPPGKPYVSPPTDRIAVPGITNVSFCSTGCEGTINGMTAFADETTRTCVGTCPSGTTIDYLTKKCVGQGACPPAKPWYDINAKSCLNDTELGLFGSAKYQSVGSNPGKLGVCAQGKKKNTGTTGGLCVPVSSGEKDQMTDVIGNYGWNILGFGNDTAAAAYCSANGGALMNPKTCSTCGAGQYVNPSTGQCTACPINTYKSGNGWKLSDCLACPSGTGTNGATGQTSTVGCAQPPCPVGQTRAADGVTCFTPITSCPAGQQKNANGNYCEPCPAGTYKSDTSLNACTTCGPGSKVTGNSTACSPIYTKYTNTNVPKFDDYTLSQVPFYTANKRGAIVTGTLNDAYNACDNLPGCAGFSRQNLVYSLNTVKTAGNDSTRNYQVLMSSATAAGARTADSKYDFYKKN
jgi:hypothetical protein